MDGDGDRDLFVCHNEAPNQLYINNGDGTFSEEAAKRGIDFNGNSVMMAFADYDRDGDLDAYLATYRLSDEGREIKKPTINADGTIEISRDRADLEFTDVLTSADGKSRVIKSAQYDHLYQNNGDGTFTDVSEAAGMDGNYYGLSAVWWDYDRDGWVDLYVSNDFYSPDQLYHNNGCLLYTSPSPRD